MYHYYAEVKPFALKTSHSVQASHLHVKKLCSVIIKADKKGTSI